MGGRSLLLAAALAAYVIAACATGGEGDPLEGGTGSPDSPPVTDAPSHPHDGSSGDPDSFQNPDTAIPPTDSTMPPGDTSMMDTFVPPTDSGGPPVDTGVPPVDTGVMDSPPPMDVVTVTPPCSLLNIKYALEDSILGENAVPCSLGCTSKQCCWHGVSPPVCLAK